MQLKRDQEAQRLSSAAEKARIKSDYEARISDLKKSHAAEKQQLTARHKNDTEQVKKVAQTRKVKNAPAGTKNKVK
jgi:hypothetical protein